MRIQTLLLTALFISRAYANHTIPFQGQVADQSGSPLDRPTVNLVFRLYSAPVAGTAIWEEAQPGISVNSGRFSVLLGSRTELPPLSTLDSTLYLGITVDDGNPATADVELRPRQALVPVLSARYANTADTLDGFDWRELFGAGNPSTGTILSSKIADGSIKAAKLEAHSIHPGLIASNSITATQISPGTITPLEIKPASLTLSALAKEVLDQLVPPGTIISYGGSTNTLTEDNGWILCDGRPLSSANSKFARLYAAISTNWGSGIQNSQFDFNAPDLRGMFLRGVNHNRSDGYNDQGANARTYAVPVGGQNTGGRVSGNSGPAVGSVQANRLSPHRHRWGIVGTQSPARARSLDTWNVDGTRIATLVDAVENNLDEGTDVRDNFKQINPSGGSLYTEPLSTLQINGETHPVNAAVNFMIKL